MKRLLVSLVSAMLLFLQSCTQINDRVEEALELSGSNRTELEKVLLHFSQEEKDSLHLKSAKFLIENMPGHYSWYSTELNQYWCSMDSIYRDMPQIIKQVVYSIPWHNSEMTINKGRKKEDIQTIKADYLISHINNVMNMWQQCPWLKEYSFEDICEYLLPYRLGDEPLVTCDSTQYRWKYIMEEMNQYGYKVRLLDEVRHFLRAQVGNAEEKYFPRLNVGDYLSKNYTMDCLDVCYYDVLGLRQAGVPSTIDLIPNWATRNGRHYWRVIHDLACINDNYSETINPLAGKVYRMTYSHNSIPLPNGKDSIPDFFQNPFLKDVSDKYMKTTDIHIKVERKSKGHYPNYLYLAVFNDLEWKPIAWSKNTKNGALFTDVGLNVVYLPVCYRGSRMESVGNPFLIDRNGNPKTFIPDRIHRISITLRRKYPMTYSKIHWGKSLENCVLEASNDSKFQVSDTLAIIDESSAELNWQTLSVKTEKAYRYWRISKEQRHIAFAELQFISLENEVLQGKVLFSGKSEGTEKAFDKNPLSYHNYFSFVGVDLGKPSSLKEVRFLPRTDYNGIIPGNLYRLQYFDGEGWTEFETKEAIGQSITFHEVPSGALYWLQNLTEGKEERIFAVEDGRIIFY